jgi:pimeloyl-ACP methyl ester carboxylesterase
MRLEVDGTRVFVGTGSREHVRDAPWLLFVHGAGFDHTIWVMPARHFARRGFNVLAPDLPGHGRSDGPALTSIGATALWLGRLLDTVGAGASALVGHSMGALVAWQFATESPERCAALALLGPSAPMPVTDRLLAAARDGDHAAIEMANAWSHSRHGRLGGNANPGVWMFGAGERLLEAASGESFSADLEACNGFDAAVLGPFAGPALVIAGDRDQMTPIAKGIDAAARLGNARLVRLAGCGHSMLSEQPNEVLDALIELLGR